MADVEVRIEGLDKVLAKFDNLAQCSGIINGMSKACELVERDAKQKAPKDTGALRRSITSKVKADGNEVTGVVFTPLEYAPYIEFGTGLYAENGNGRKTPWSYQDDEGKWHYTKGYKGATGHGTPYMRPALEQNREKIIQLIKEGALND